MTNDPTRSRPSYQDPTARKLFAPAAGRNAGPIAAVLTGLLAGGDGTVVEIGSGTGQHAAAFAAALPHLTWQPTDPDPAHRASIAAWAEDGGPANLRAPIALDATSDWAPRVGPARAVFCANVIHIAPWAVAEGLVAGAARALAPGGLLILYGPFFEDGAAAPSNLDFDRDLRARDPSFGVRDAADVAALAAPHFAPPRRFEMPADNLILAFARR